MAFDIGSVLRALMSGGKLSPDIINAAAGASPSGPPTGGAPAASEPPPIPESYKSPPDLVAMYTKLMEQSQRTAAFQRGATMIAAGLSPYQDTRDALLATVGKGGAGAGAGGISMDSLIQLQKMQQEQGDRAARASQLPALGAKYGLDPATLEYLDRTGGLDTVIQELAKPHTQVIQTAAHGNLLIDTRDGHVIQSLSPDEPPETAYIDSGDGKGDRILVDKRTNVPIGSKDGKPFVFLGPTVGDAETAAKTAAMPAEQQLKERAAAVSEGQLGVNQGELAIKQKEADRKSASDKTLDLLLPAIEKQYGIPEATAMTLKETGQLGDVIKTLAVPDNEIVKSEVDKSIRVVDKRNGATVRVLEKGRSPDEDTEFHKFDDGHEELIYSKSKRRVSDGTLITETPAKDPLLKEHEAAEEINAWRKAHNLTPLSPGQLAKIGIYGGQTINVGTGGVGGGKVQEGYEVVTDPDTLEPVRDKNGDVVTRKIGGAGGPTAAAEAQDAATLAKTQADAAKANQEVVDAQLQGRKLSEGQASKEVRDMIDYKVVSQEAKESIELIDKHHKDFLGVTGWGGPFASIPGDTNDSRRLANRIATITTHIGIKELQALRDASKTGAALGNVTNYEDQMLKGISGRFDQSGNDMDLKRNLKRYMVAQDLLVKGIHDPSVPKTKDNPLQMRLPTEAEVDRAMDAVPSYQEPEGTSLPELKGYKVLDKKPVKKE